MSIHDGHRQRLKQRYVSGGAAQMSEHEVLELILTYAIPRRNVNVLAHELINRYGSLASVFRESVSGLVSNKGVSLHTAVLIKLFGDAVRNMLFSKNSAEGVCIRSVKDAMELCADILGSDRVESFCPVMLDANNCVVDYYIETGSACAVPMETQRLASRALNCGAVAVVLAHSHPSGEAKPSLADERLTEQIKNMLAAIKIPLLEHIIVTGDDCYAMMHEVRLSDIAVTEADSGSAYRFRIG